MAQLTFRKASPSDLKALLKINNEVQPHPWTRKALASELSLDSLASQIALDQNRPCAYLLCRQNKPELEVMTLGVASSYQRQGLAQQLFGKIFQEWPDFHWVFLEVSAQNNPAITLYKKLGFELLGQRKAYYADGADALTFKLHLAKTQ